MRLITIIDKLFKMRTNEDALVYIYFLFKTCKHCGFQYYFSQTNAVIHLTPVQFIQFHQIYGYCLKKIHYLLFITTLSDSEPLRNKVLLNYKKKIHSQVSILNVNNLSDPIRTQSIKYIFT